MSQLLEGPPLKGAAGGLRTKNQIDAPDWYHNGIPYDDNEGTAEVAVDTTNAVSFYHQGLPFTAAGRIPIDNSSAIDQISSGGMPLTADGKLATIGTGVDGFQCGVPYNSADRIVAV